MSVDINQDDIGKTFTDSRGEQWKCIGYCSRPTVTMERIGGAQDRITFGIDGNMARTFKRVESDGGQQPA